MVTVKWQRSSAGQRILPPLVRMQLLLATARAERAAPGTETWPARCVHLGTTLAGVSALVLLAALRRHR
jgi:hypothetical protein